MYHGSGTVAQCREIISIKSLPSSWKYQSISCLKSDSCQMSIQRGTLPSLSDLKPRSLRLFLVAVALTRTRRTRWVAIWNQHLILNVSADTEHCVYLSSDRWGCMVNYILSTHIHWLFCLNGQFYAVTPAVAGHQKQTSGNCGKITITDGRPDANPVAQPTASKHWRICQPSAT